MSKNKNQKHTITQEDLEHNPDLVGHDLKVGDEVLLGEAVESAEVIAKLEQAVEDNNQVIQSLKSEIAAKDQEIETLKKLAADQQPIAEVKNTDGKVIVHFGVSISGKDYSISDILKDKDIQNHLLDIGSGAISKVTKG